MLGKDVFVSLPTGSGKSLCFAALPYVFEYLRKVKSRDQPFHSAIVICVCPLSALMQDQVATVNVALTQRRLPKTQTWGTVMTGVCPSFRVGVSFYRTILLCLILNRLLVAN